MTKRVRALFYRPDAQDPYGSAWLDFEAPATMTLLHDYGADLPVAAGWSLVTGAPARPDGVRHFKVTSVSGLVLTVAERGA